MTGPAADLIEQGRSLLQRPHGHLANHREYDAVVDKMIERLEALEKENRKMLERALFVESKWKALLHKGCPDCGWTLPALEEQP